MADLTESNYLESEDHSTEELYLLAAIKSRSTPLVDESATELAYLTERGYAEENGERLTDAEYFLDMPDLVGNDHSTVSSREIESAFEALLDEGKTASRRIKDDINWPGAKKEAELLVELPENMEVPEEFDEKAGPHVYDALNEEDLGKKVYLISEELDTQLYSELAVLPQEN